MFIGKIGEVVAGKFITVHLLTRDLKGTREICIAWLWFDLSNRNRGKGRQNTYRGRARRRCRSPENAGDRRRINPPQLNHRRAKRNKGCCMHGSYSSILNKTKKKGGLKLTGKNPQQVAGDFFNSSENT